ncbi:MAG: STAS domain-containing protein [Gammaproteobacteria bacterium]|nr:STAS domain-containing protein [Gammaproteobacteria bacterium]
MTSKKGGSVIGFDPLAWMKEDASAPPAAGTSGAPKSAEPRAATQAANVPPAPKAGNTPGVVHLGEALTIEQVSGMHAELGRHASASPVVLDAGKLDRIDAAGLQLLTAFVLATEHRGARVEWRSPAAALREGARRTGLTTVLRLN